MRFGVLAIFALLASGCVSFENIDIPEGRVSTPGVEIRAADGSFVLRSGERFSTPFYGDNDCGTARYLGPRALEVVKQKGRAVEIRSSEFAEPFYGYLVFCRVWQATSPTGPGNYPMGAGVRSYEIRVPAANLAEGLDGGWGSVFETVDMSMGRPPPLVTWILYFTDEKPW